MGSLVAASPDALADFLARCDPASPAPSDLYVARPSPFAPWLAKTLSRVDSAKILVIGQAGVGKSTELARLADSLSKAFTIVRPPLDQILDLSLVGWHDILVVAALWFRKTSLSGPLPARSPALQLEEELVPRTLAIVADTPRPTGLQAMRNDPLQVHKRIDAGRAQFWDLSLAVLSHVQRPILLVLDGLEKLPPACMDRLFLEQRRYITELPLRTVVTAPLAMSFLPYFGEVEGDFLAVTRLRALSHRPGEPGFSFLKELAARREADRVIDASTLDEMISWSGGLPRQLLQLLAASATQALTEGMSRVEHESFVRARRKVTERWQYQLEPADYKSLSKAEEERTTAERSRLLSLGALLEYDQPDGGLGLGINPLVGALLKQRKPTA